jgi:hypothetical protein
MDQSQQASRKTSEDGVGLCGDVIYHVGLRRDCGCAAWQTCLTSHLVSRAAAVRATEGGKLGGRKAGKQRRRDNLFVGEVLG